MVVGLFGLGTSTRRGSALTGRVGPRLGWTLLVAVGGLVLGGYLMARLADLGVGYAYLLPGSGLALVAAALTRPRVVRLPAIGVMVLLVGGVTVVHAHQQAEERAEDLARRLDYARTEGDLVFVTALPGYGQAGGSPEVTATTRFAVTYSPPGGAGGRIMVWAIRDGLPDCLPEQPGGPGGYPLRCVRETPERSYQALPPDLHEYLTVRGDRVVHVRATRDVDRGTLRAAADNVRQATSDELERLLPHPPGRWRG